MKNVLIAGNQARDNEDARDPKKRKTKLKFKIINGLIYNTESADNLLRLYIPNKLEREVFKLTYNNLLHNGFNRTYDRIIRLVYLRGLSKRLRIYISYY